MKVNNFLIIGNDPKMHECKVQLQRRGFDADIADENEVLSKIRLYDCVILPLPTISNGCVSGTCLTLEDIIENLSDKQYLFTGNVDCCNYDNCLSYYNESFLVKNSYLTAQGVLRLILECVDCSVYGQKTAVIGYGRCGKAVSKLLDCVGMNVTVFARRIDTLTQVYYDGYLSKNISAIDDCLNNYDIIVNTVPNNIITDNGVKKLTSGNIYIEIASKPYGFNIIETDLYNFKYILGKSLPGRFYPKSAGTNIADTVIEIIKEV